MRLRGEGPKLLRCGRQNYVAAEEAARWHNEVFLKMEAPPLYGSREHETLPDRVKRLLQEAMARELREAAKSNPRRKPKRGEG